jgi:copper homeostasis protein
VKIIREACVENYDQAKRAAELGADRIELCDNMAVLGTTPSYGTIELARKNLGISIFPIIRPRGGDFVYTEEELQIMERDIDVCREIGVDGVVFGILTEAREIDIAAMARLIKRCGELKVACHLAFDETPDRYKALDALIGLGVIRVATKGRRERTPALSNAGAIKELIEYSAGRITIMPAVGVTVDNYLEVAEKTGAREVHGTKIVGDLTR